MGEALNKETNNLGRYSMISFKPGNLNQTQTILRKPCIPTYITTNFLRFSAPQLSPEISLPP